MTLYELLAAYREPERRTCSGPFGDYLKLVKRRPEVADLVHARIHHIISKLTSASSEGELSPRWFAGELFGLDRPLAELATYFAAAARRLDVRNRMLVLVGPVGGGKSTIVTLLKRSLEAYARTDEGALYGISGCPMHEEPLHLVPPDLRRRFEAELGVHIEGSLCPVCQAMVQRWDGSLLDVPVERLRLSEQDRVGIGTFSPSDPKSQDMSELTGSMDLSTIGTYGVESDPRAYRFDGELNVASRGLMEFIELLKADERFLYALLTLTSEQKIKTPRFPLIYADEAVVGHTNEAEYRAFLANPKNEALKDRMIAVKVPYTLRVSEEVRIYRKLLGRSDLGSLHLAPHTLEVSAMFAVISRLKESRRNGLTLIKKMRLYDGQAVDGFSAQEVAEIASEHEEGMAGLSPRYVMNRLSFAAVDVGAGCLGPQQALAALGDGLSGHPGIDRREAGRLSELLGEVAGAYREMALDDVQQALCPQGKDPEQAQFEAYMASVESALAQEGLGEDEGAPDEALMGRIEEKLGVMVRQRRAFRQAMLVRVVGLRRRGKAFDARAHAGLLVALRKDRRAGLRGKEVPEELIESVMGALFARGYCGRCAREVLSQAALAEAVD